jgi:hypothetical protein
MKTIEISDTVELVIVDDGGVALKDLFNDRSIAILPTELTKLIDALTKAKSIHEEKIRKLSACSCNAYVLENFGCKCDNGKKYLEKNLR